MILQVVESQRKIEEPGLPFPVIILLEQCAKASEISTSYLEPNRPLFLKVNSPKQGQDSNQNKGHLGSM